MRFGSVAFIVAVCEEFDHALRSLCISGAVEDQSQAALRRSVLHGHGEELHKLRPLLGLAFPVEVDSQPDAILTLDKGNREVLDGLLGGSRAQVVFTELGHVLEADLVASCTHSYKAFQILFRFGDLREIRLL